MATACDVGILLLGQTLLSSTPKGWRRLQTATARAKGRRFKDELLHRAFAPVFGTQRVLIVVDRFTFSLIFNWVQIQNKYWHVPFLPKYMYRNKTLSV